MVDFSDAKKRFEEIEGFIKNNNYKIINLTDEECILDGIITETSMNPYGMAHGGYIFGLADTASGILAATLGPAVTIDSSIYYLKPLKTDSVRAISTFDKKGKNISIFSVKVYDSNNILVATATNTYFYINKDKNS